MIEHHIALWSCPRSRSTALARSFEQRRDCIVIDEPFYAAYLTRAGMNHPGRDEILRTQECDPVVVVAQLRRPLPPNVVFAFQKHIAKNIFPEFGVSWFPVRNVFLIREPAEIVLSLRRIIGDGAVCPEEVDIESLYRIFLQVSEQSASTPLVIHASDLIASPRRVLERVCAEIDVPFEESMLHWEAGLTDSSLLFTGSLASAGDRWYGGVARSTHFVHGAGPEEVPDHLKWSVDACEPTYTKLLEYCIRFDASDSARYRDDTLRGASTERRLA
jgi:hypothetical protein